MDAAQDADRDLQDIMADVKAITTAKQALRDLISKVGRDVAANTDASDRQLTFGEDGLGGEQSYHHATIPMPDACAPGGLRTVATDLHPGPIRTEDQLSVIRDTLTDRLDNMGTLSEVTALRLQMAMDRRSKFMEALSNIMKKLDSTQETIVQNLKG